MNTWNDLSLSEKSEMMRVAIENGITTLPEIKEAYNQFAEGGNLFSGEENHSSQMHQGYVYDVLPKMLKEAGLNVRVTSGYRKPGQAGTAGSRSWHTHHGAVDIVPQGKTTFEDIENALYNNPIISRYMIDNGFGLIDESGRTAESKATMKKTGATGAHFHIGKDSKAVSAYNNKMSSIWDSNMSQLETAINQPALPVFMPSNPQAFFAPLESYQRPVVVEEPLVQAAMESAYSPEQIEREERAQGLRNLGLAMSIMRGGQSSAESSSLWDTVGLLTGSQYKQGGKIHIKPSHRGRLTELKKRTGKTEAELYKNGSAATRKMITFARNARKWKHELGGNLFSGEDTPTQQMNNGLNLYRRTNNLGETEYIYQETPDSEEILLTPTNKRFSDDPTNWDYEDASGRKYSPRMTTTYNPGEIREDTRGPLERMVDNYFGELKYQVNNNVPISGKYIMPAIAAAPFLAWAGEAAYPYVYAALANPYVDAGITSAFAGHGLNHAINEGINGWGDAAMTALEIAPLGRLAKPMWNAVKLTRNFIPTAESNMAGVRYAYNRNPELANIGTLEEYNDYIKTVFPESKVRDINYHMGPKGLQELNPSTGEVWNTNPDARGIYVTPDKSYVQKIRKFTTDRLEKPSAWTYLKRNLTPGGWDKANETFTDIYPVMIDTKNPLYTKGTWTWGIKDNKYQSLMDKHDAIVNSGPKWYQNFNSMPEAIVPRTEQTLILGSDRDVAGFKNFMSQRNITSENAASITRTIQDNGKIRLSLPSHTDAKPRQFVLEPQGDNKFYVHMRTWDGDHVPANLSNEDKQTLFQALYDELPDGAEILFPKSGPGYYSTRGTVAGLRRLARDSRFTPGTKGTLQYLDKDGKTIKTYEGTSFIKTPQITAENAASITLEQWTAAQDAAIAAGDMAEAQRLRDLHASLTPTATPGKYYRGTNTKRNSYPDRHIDEEVGEMNGIYLTKKPKYAKTYGDVEEFYLRSNNPLYTEGNWTGVIDDATRAKIENAGYDAVVNDRFDTGFLNKLFKNSRDETITFDGRNIKLADAVTYDDNGVRIPLGKRDNFKINDIRYGLLPFLGLGTAGTLYGKQE